MHRKRHLVNRQELKLRRKEDKEMMADLSYSITNVITKANLKMHITESSCNLDHNYMVIFFSLTFVVAGQASEGFIIPPTSNQIKEKAMEKSNN